jgi:hypothetical protein
MAWVVKCGGSHAVQARPARSPSRRASWKATWRGRSVNIGSPASLAPRAVHDNDPLLPPRWGVQVAVDLQVDETGALNPGVSFIEPLSDGQSRALGLGVGPAARERVYGKQTRAPRQPSADGEHGYCRQIARYCHHRSQSSCGKTRSEVTLELRIAGEGATSR